MKPSLIGKVLIGIIAIVSFGVILVRGSTADPPNPNEIDVYVNGDWFSKGILIDGSPYIPEKIFSKLPNVQSAYDKKWKKVSISIETQKPKEPLTPSISQTPKTKSERKDLTYDESEFEDERDSLNQLHITGKVKNTSGRMLSYVEVKFNGFDKNGAQIETSIDNTTDLANGDTWRFDAWFFEEKVEAWRLIRVGT